MSLLMQALRKAERARSQNGDEHEGEQHFGQDAVPSPPPIEGGPAFAVMPDAWRLEPLDAEPPVVAAQEAAHDPVPPQARHEPARASRPRPEATPFVPATGAAGRPESDQAPGPQAGGRGPGIQAPAPPRPAASPQNRLLILGGTLLALVAVFAFIYWRAVSAPGPGARLPMVPMPASGAPPALQAGAPQGAAIPVTPYIDAPNSGAAAPAGDAANPPATATASPQPTFPQQVSPQPPSPQPASPQPASELAAAPLAGTPAAATPTAVMAPAAIAPAAPASKPAPVIAIPTPAQLAAISDPAIRAEAMRDATERAARQVQLEGAQAPGPMQPQAPVAEASLPHVDAPPPPLAVRAPHGRQPRAAAKRAGGAAASTSGATASASSAAKTAEGKPPMAIGKAGDVRFVRSAATAKVAPALRNGYAALQAGDLATARREYDLALMQDPNSRDALLGSAAVALREHDGRQASSNYLRLLELDPNDPEALAGLAGLHPGDLQTSETRLRGLARQHPESGPVQFALGNLYARQGRWPEAQQSYFHAFNAMPENADYAFNLGVGLDRMNQPRLAQTYYRRALELAQASPPGFNVDAVRKRLQVLETPPQ